MKKEPFNTGWIFLKDDGNALMKSVHGAAASGKTITLPHDAMIHEDRTADTVSQAQTGFYPGGKYLYLKKFFVPAEWREETVSIKFEGIYGISKVFVNGEFAAISHNGYRALCVKLDHHLKYGMENEIRVEVNNTAEPSSRWYSGSGIYRDVWLQRSKFLHIVRDGVKIDVKSADSELAVLSLTTQIQNEAVISEPVQLAVEIMDGTGARCASDGANFTVFGGECEKIVQRLVVMNPKLWSCDGPNLYTCRLTVKQGESIVDREEITFGIRTLQLDPVHGLRVNGMETKLRGACIHHDNGIIGACTLAAAEERRCRLLKEAGFNAIRSAHNPLSEAMLRACDKLGMFVIDELSDVWNVAKNTNDYSNFFAEEWERDVEDLVRKDMNHPSVIAYCIGNEIAEISTGKGASFARRISNRFRELDPERYTTLAINGLLAASGHMPAIMRDIAAAKARVESHENRKINNSGSNALNNMMGMLVGETADQMAVHPLMSEAVEEAAASVDISGFNYMTARHSFEHTYNPNRVVLGSETFPSELMRLWNIVEQTSSVIGDMTWTGYDYLGEAGIGIFYYDGRKNFGANWPDSIAYCGDLDIIGYRRPVSYLREIAYGLRNDPYIAVERLDIKGNLSSKTPWMLTDSVASWTWPGFEGKTAKVDVYARCDEVELLLNGSSVSKRQRDETTPLVFRFEIPYSAGELTAIAWDCGKKIGTCTLATAGKPSNLHVKTECDELRANGMDAAFLTISLRDDHGTVNMFDKARVKIDVDGPLAIEGFGSADPQTECAYQSKEWDTYDGYLMACLRTGSGSGKAVVTFEAEGVGKATVELDVKE